MSQTSEEWDGWSRGASFVPFVLWFLNFFAASVIFSATSCSAPPTPSLCFHAAIATTQCLRPCCSLRWNALLPFSANRSFCKANPLCLGNQPWSFGNFMAFFFFYILPILLLPCFILFHTRIDLILTSICIYSFNPMKDLRCLVNSATDRHTNQTTDQKEIRSQYWGN